MLSSTQIFATIVLVICAPGLLSLAYGFVQGLRGKVRKSEPTMGELVDSAIARAMQDGYSKGSG
jgi:hypothetical protein